MKMQFTALFSTAILLFPLAVVLSCHEKPQELSLGFKKKSDRDDSRIYEARAGGRILLGDGLPAGKTYGYRMITDGRYLNTILLYGNDNRLHFHLETVRKYYNKRLDCRTENLPAGLICGLSFRSNRSESYRIVVYSRKSSGLQKYGDYSLRVLVQSKSAVKFSD